MSREIRVLVVEDSVPDTELLLRELCRNGYVPTHHRVETAEAMGEALDRERWDIVIADYTMPRFSAPAALEVLRARNLDIPFIILSGSIGEEAGAGAMTVGADDYVTKDNLARLIPAIQRELGEAESREARRRAESALEIRMRQQEAVAELGQRALRVGDLQKLFDYTVNLLTNTLGVPLCKILELAPDGKTLLLRAGVGWKPGLVGSARVGAVIDSQAGFTLRQNQPVIVEDLRTETRFRGTSLLTEHGVVSGMSVVIHGRNRSFGVLGVHTTERRAFTRNDNNFLLSVANVLAAAIERQRGEDALQRLAAIVNSTDDAVYRKGIDGIIESWNPGAERLYGYTSAEIIGRSVAFLMPVDRGAELPHLLERLRRGESIEQYETIRKRKDGTLVHVSLTVSPLHDDTGAVIGASTIARDITDRKRLEEQAFQLQKMESISQLAGGIAHHFNNLMGGVMGFSELLLRRIDPDDPVHRYAKQIVKSAERASSLTRQLLLFSRNVPRNVNPIELNASLCSLEATVRSLLPDSIELQIDTSRSREFFEADASQIEQLILNLVSNARDAMSGGGVLTLRGSRVTLADDRSTARGVIPAGEYVQLSVADTGRGMSEEVKSHLFEPFYTTKELNQGTGLGLATCYAIVKQSQGYIEVESSEGGGTSVSVFFPKSIRA